MKNKDKKVKIQKVLEKSPINYFSDLFVFAMVAAWIIALIVMTFAAFYSMIVLKDTSVWVEVGTLVAVPLTAGGAIWMIKNSVQHAIASHKGKKCPYDFPAVNAEGEDDGIEEPVIENFDEEGGVG